MRLLLVAALLCCTATNARADDVADAKAHYQLGASAYEKGHYDDAIREFEASYALSKRPEILWNLARAAEKQGRDDKAVGYLKQYLAAAPDASDVPSVRAEIEALERSRADRQAMADAEAAAARARADADAAQRRAIEAQAAAAKASARPKWPAYVALAGGAALVATGVVLGVVAESAASDAASGKATTGTAGRFDGGVETRGKLAAGFGIGCDVVGGVLLAGGVGLLLWSRGHDGGETHARLAPAPGGLLVAGSF